MSEMAKQADAFDLELFRLMERANGYIKSAPPHSGLSRKWGMVAEHLRYARAPVREMMSPEDRAKT